MSAVRVKICGITRPEDAALAGRLGAWAVGLVFAPGSPRRLDLAAARRAAAARPSGVLAVGVFLDQPEDEMLRLAESVPLDLLQLHGSETPEMCRALGAERVIKAITLRSGADLDAAVGFGVGYLLADRPRPESGTEANGFHPAESRRLAAALAARCPRMLLAGGLGPGDAAQALAGTGAWGLDLSSGVESSPGVKDPAKLKALFSALGVEARP